VATGICRRIGNKTSTYERLTDHPVISNISFKTRKTLAFDRFGPRATEILQIAGCVYVPISFVYILARTEIRTHLDNFIGEKAPRRVAPRRPQRHRRILVFRFRSRDAFFLCIPGTRLSPARGAPRRIDTPRRSVSVSSFCRSVQARLLVLSDGSLSSPDSEPRAALAGTSQDLFVRGYARAYAYVSRTLRNEWRPLRRNAA